MAHASDGIRSKVRATGRGELVQTVATVVGASFLLVGVLGFVPGVTTHYDDLGLAGHDSMAELLGVFQVSVLHNVLHLLLGIAGLVLARTATTAKLFLLAGGAGYLALWVYGLLVESDSGANVVPLNTADDWLHLGLGAGMVVLGLVVPRRDEVPPAA